MKLKILTIVSILIINQYVYANTDLIFKSGMENIMRPLNDTGITWAAEYPTGNNTNCTSTTIPSPQDCNFGRDFTHNDDSDGHAGFSFTKLDATGTPLVDQSIDYATIPWACVSDNVTGLVWEVKTITAGIHNKDNLYQWGGLTAIGRNHPNRQGSYYDLSWNELLQNSNAEKLCGLTNWRVPTIAELSSIINQNIIDPSIDSNYFPNTEPSWFWSSTPAVGLFNSAWAVLFFNSYAVTSGRDNGSRVRLVSSR